MGMQERAAERGEQLFVVTRQTIQRLTVSAVDQEDALYRARLTRDDEWKREGTPVFSIFTFQGE